MNPFLKPGSNAPVAGTYVEVGHGGGKVKNPERVELQQGGTLPDLKSYTVKIEHKGEEKTRNRQHKWILEV
ncbi:YjzC family protein [Bacillus niameyensis]|uniref:YjzC family protein n=1 Tax=Bacillus niameyensis TaxID=1522308 RepID=UPI00078481BC|nr:YjzC family protein [Bacillus niameyensis]